ncbi:MAG: translation initiation factor IF-3 [Patescibacteria group bacterium]|nr:translation initiation factor IF-3 [Patescibacteria group bacterium]
MNENIRAPKVRLIDENGNQVGVVSRKEALFAAEQAGLDLVEVSSGDTPVCKILDYGKYKYEQDKKSQKSKKAQKSQEMKIIRLSVKIGKHDFDTKAKKAKKFIEKGHKLSLELRFKGREMVHKDLGEKVLRDFATELGDIRVDQEPKLAGRSISMVVSPGKKS